MNEQSSTKFLILNFPKFIKLNLCNRSFVRYYINNNDSIYKSICLRHKVEVWYEWGKFRKKLFNRKWGGTP